MNKSNVVSPSSSEQVPVTVHLIWQLAFVLVIGGALLIGTGREAKLDLNLNGQHRIFTGVVTPGMTVLDALSASVAAGNIQMQFVVDKNDLTNITMLGGRAPKDIKFFVNSQSLPPERIHQVTVKPRDLITVTDSQN